MAIIQFASMLKTPVATNPTTPSTNTSGNFVIVQQEFGGNFKAGNKTTRVMDGTTPFIGSRAWMPTYQGARWFIGFSDADIRVIDESWAVKSTITNAVHQAGTAYRIHSYNGKFCIVGSTGIRFGTYNQTTDTWTNGTLLANEVPPLDSVIDTSNGRIYISSAFGGTIARNVTVLDITTETVIDRQTVAGSSNLSQISVGSMGLLVVANDGTARLVDKTNFATIGGLLSFPNIFGAIAYSNGKFWLTQQTNATLKSVDETNGSIVLAQSGVSAPSGCVSDANFVYMAEQTANKITVIDSLTGAINGSAITGFNSPVFRTA
jgi:hypothetical protein